MNKKFVVKNLGGSNATLWDLMQFFAGTQIMKDLSAAPRTAEFSFSVLHIEVQRMLLKGPFDYKDKTLQARAKKVFTVVSE